MFSVLSLTIWFNTLAINHSFIHLLIHLTKRYEIMKRRHSFNFMAQWVFFIKFILKKYSWSWWRNLKRGWNIIHFELILWWLSQYVVVFLIFFVTSSSIWVLFLSYLQNNNTNDVSNIKSFPKKINVHLRQDVSILVIL